MQGAIMGTQGMKLAGKGAKTAGTTERQQNGLPQARNLKTKKECIFTGHFGLKTSSRREFCVL